MSTKKQNRAFRAIVFSLFFAFMAHLPIHAQGDGKVKISGDDYANQGVEMADTMRANGKIYVVVGVMGMILAGMLFYVAGLDRKISKLEKELNP